MTSVSTSLLVLYLAVAPANQEIREHFPCNVECDLVRPGDVIRHNLLALLDERAVGTGEVAAGRRHNAGQDLGPEVGPAEVAMEDGQQPELGIADRALGQHGLVARHQVAGVGRIS